MFPPDSYNTFQLPDIFLSHHPSSSQTVTPIIVIKLHRPAARNGFTDQLANSLITAFDTLSSDPRVRCIVLTSSDPSNKSFCVGMDLNSRDDTFGPNTHLHRDKGGQVSLAIHRCHKPVIAAINGAAVGVGITVTLPCTIRVASADAKIGFVFSRRGFCLEACSSFFLPRLIGASKAMHLLTTGGVYPSGHKLFGDLFSEVVPRDEVLPTAMAIAEDVVQNTSGVSNVINKELVFRGAASPEEAHLLESTLFYDLMNGKDGREGRDSFMQKRSPEFKATMEQDAPTVYPWWKSVDVRKPQSKI